MIRTLWRWLWGVTLRPGKCECAHMRCAHIRGRKGCMVMITVGMGLRGTCACQVFIASATGDVELDELRKIAEVGKH